MTDYDKDRWYWLRKENRKMQHDEDLSLWTGIKFTWGRNWDGFWQWFWYKLNRCPVCKKKIFWEWDGEYGDYGSVIWEGLMPYHVDEDSDCEGVC